MLGTDKGYAATRLAFPLTMSFSGISVAAFEAEKATFRALAAAAFTFNVASDCTPAPTVANWDNYLCDTASPLARLGCHEEVGRQIFDIQAAEAGEEGLITVRYRCSLYRTAESNTRQHTAPVQFGPGSVVCVFDFAA